MAKPKLKALQPGYDGAVEIETSVRITATRSESRSLRCRPGSFEWRYGRANADAALYHAGIKFADLWERAGTASASSPDFSSSSSGGQWKGIPDGRVLAMSEINDARKDMGRWSTARLVDYCVMGSTASEMAQKYNTDDRSMAIVLNEDLRACAMHFRQL